MEKLKVIAEKSNNKLNQQIDEFNILRDRVLILAGFGLTMLTAIFTFWNNYGENYKLALLAISFVSLISIAILIYAAFSNKLSRGMDSLKIKYIVEELDIENYYLEEIAYNLHSFTENSQMLKYLQLKLNLGLTVQTIVTLTVGITTYLNGI